MLPKIQLWLTQLHQSKGSDLHLRAGSVPMIRIMGELVPCSNEPSDNQELLDVLRAITRKGQFETFEKNHELDFRWEIPGLGYYRVNFFETLCGLAAAFREIPCNIPTFEQLGLDPDLKRLAMLPNGLVLITGPTGSGKSTALSAIIDYANKHRRDHIVTIEDPIEFVYENEQCMVSQREVGTHTNSFASALRVVLREDPDVIVVGEMRDLETIELTLRAAETGHLVFATLHTSSAASTIDRIINVFPAEQQQQIRMTLSQALKSVLSVTLLKRADNKGRVQAMEILHATPPIRNLIRDGRVYQIPSVLQTNRHMGMRTLDMHLTELYEQGVITRETALHAAHEPQILASKL
ncbi:MAG: type IV pilus twitching motility protein PilT [Sutterella sp.]|nr:type IV pilus twitching motility protein PilT [Sutterella sp.]